MGEINWQLHAHQQELYILKIRSKAFLISQMPDPLFAGLRSMMQRSM